MKKGVLFADVTRDEKEEGKIRSFLPYNFGSRATDSDGKSSADEQATKTLALRTTSKRTGMNWPPSPSYARIRVADQELIMIWKIPLHGGIMVSRRCKLQSSRSLEYCVSHSWTMTPLFITN